MVYLDTGCLVKLYYPEPDSDLVAARSSGQVIVYTPLHALELTTALELKVFRKEATIGQARAALGLVEEDLSAGKLVAVNTALLDSLDAAVQLARQHAARTGAGLSVKVTPWGLVLSVVFERASAVCLRRDQPPAARCLPALPLACVLC